jgi:signal transduction histidine kinase
VNGQEPESIDTAPPARSSWNSRAISWAADVTPPVLLSAVAAHELLFNRSGPVTWLLVMSIIWPLVLRRRAPVMIFAASLVLALAFWATNTFTVANLSVLVALYSVAAHRSTRYALCAAAAVEVGVVLIALRFAPTDSFNDAIILLSGLAAAALFLGTTMRSQRRYLASIEERTRQLEHERSQQAQLAAATERTRIAREMHDIVAHGLSVVITLAQGAAIAVEENPHEAARAMEQAADAGRQSLQEMRKLLQVLRDDTPARKDPEPDLTALDQLIGDVRQTGLTVHLVSHGDYAQLSAATQTTVYRIVQEALTNVLKHADHATAATVTLDFASDEVRLSVENDDRPSGRPVSQAFGNGVIGMRERVALFGGSVDSSPTAAGWLVRGHLPIA